MIPLLYANNADIKYPLSDFHEVDIPNDILLDLSISVPAGIDPILGALRVGPSTVFVSIEDRRNRAPVASVLVTYPVAAKVYPLDMTVVGFGWVIFGSRVTTGEPYFSGDVTVDLDPEVFVTMQKTAPRMNLTVNGFPQDITNVLTLLAGSELVTVTAENSTIYIDRNDDVMTEEDILALNAESSEDAFAEAGMLFTVAGTEPDDAGNIDIQVSGCAQDCGDVRALLLPNGNLALAEEGEMPLDIFTPRIFKTGDTCAPEDGIFENSSEAVDAFTGCNNIIAIDIIDTTESVPDCNNCDPPLAFTYTVTLSGLIGPWLAWNGAHTVTWKDGCNWYDSEEKLKMFIVSTVPSPAYYWWLVLTATPGDTLTWVGTNWSPCASPVNLFASESVDCTSTDPADCTAQGDPPYNPPSTALCAVTADLNPAQHRAIGTLYTVER